MTKLPKLTIALSAILASSMAFAEPIPPTDSELTLDFKLHDIEADSPCELVSAPSMSFGTITELGTFIAHSDLTLVCADEGIQWSIYFDEYPTALESGEIYADEYIRVWLGAIEGVSNEDNIFHRGRYTGDNRCLKDPVPANWVDGINVEQFTIYPVGSVGTNTARTRNACYMPYFSETPDNGHYSIQMSAILEVHTVPSTSAQGGIPTDFTVPLTVYPFIQ